MKFTVLLFLLSFVLCVNNSIFVQGCPSKTEAVDCFLDKGDYDGDGGLSTGELEKVAQNFLPWYIRIAFSTFGGVDQIMQDCDINTDGLISRDKAVASGTCLETCDKRAQTMTYLMCS